MAVNYAISTSHTLTGRKKDGKIMLDMKKIVKIILVVITSICININADSLQAKNPETTTAVPSGNTVLEEIESSSEGNVIFEIPEKIEEKIIAVPSPSKKQNHSQPNTVSTPRSNKAQGFRIQVFCDSRNQSSLQARARARGNAIAARFPKYRGQVYAYSAAPNWYTRVGNFKSQAEANAALAELRRAFPSFASEMRVIKCQIVNR